MFLHTVCLIRLIKLMCMLSTASNDSIQKSKTRVKPRLWLDIFFHWIKSQENADFSFRKAHKQLMYDAWSEKSYVWCCLVQLSVRGFMSGVKRDVANDESDARKQDEMYLIILKNLHVEGRIKKFWLIFFGKKDPWFYWCWAEKSGNTAAACYRNRTVSWKFRHH